MKKCLDGSEERTGREQRSVPNEKARWRSRRSRPWNSAPSWSADLDGPQIAYTSWKTTWGERDVYRIAGGGGAKGENLTADVDGLMGFPRWRPGALPAACTP